VRWTHGSVIRLDGSPVTVEILHMPTGTVARYGGRSVHVKNTEDVRADIECDMRLLARMRLVPRVHELAAQHGLTVARVSIRNQRSRWGSCSRAKAIALNFRLVQMPPDVCDYVLIHELMHLRQQNHGPRFWALVEQACPAYRDAEHWLRVQGRTLF
jgi:predicted metal-dependent hydrolase